MIFFWGSRSCRWRTGRGFARRRKWSSRSLPPHCVHEVAHHAAGRLTAFRHESGTFPASARSRCCSKPCSCNISDHGIPLNSLLFKHCCLPSLLLRRAMKGCCCGLGHMPRCCSARSIARVEKVPRATLSPGNVAHRSALLSLFAAAGVGALSLLHGMPQRGGGRILRCGGPLGLIVLAQHLLHITESTLALLTVCWYLAALPCMLWVWRGQQKYMSAEGGSQMQVRCAGEAYLAGVHEVECTHFSILCMRGCLLVQGFG